MSARGCRPTADTCQPVDVGPRRPDKISREVRAMAEFIIQPHFRLHEWVAEEKGYFAAEGLDYEFRETFDSKQASSHQQGDKVGAYQTFEKGREGNVSCACHWTVNVAAAAGHGRLFADAYSVSPCAVFVPEESPIREPKDLAG